MNVGVFSTEPQFHRGTNISATNSGLVNLSVNCDGMYSLLKFWHSNRDFVSDRSIHKIVNHSLQLLIY